MTAAPGRERNRISGKYPGQGSGRGESTQDYMTVTTPN